MYIRIIILSLLVSCCNLRHPIQISATIGKYFDYDPLILHYRPAIKGNELYLVRLILKNPCYDTIKFNRMEERIFYDKNEEGIKKIKNGKQILVPGGKLEYFISTGYQFNELKEKAKEEPLIYCITLFNDSDTVYQSKGAKLPLSKKIPTVDLNLLEFREKTFFKALKRQRMLKKMTRLRFNRKICKMGLIGSDTVYDYDIPLIINQGTFL